MLAPTPSASGEPDSRRRSPASGRTGTSRPPGGDRATRRASPRRSPRTLACTCRAHRAASAPASRRRSAPRATTAGRARCRSRSPRRSPARRHRAGRCSAHETDRSSRTPRATESWAAPNKAPRVGGAEEIGEHQRQQRGGMQRAPCGDLVADLRPVRRSSKQRRQHQRHRDHNGADDRARRQRLDTCESPSPSALAVEPVPKHINRQHVEAEQRDLIAPDRDQPRRKSRRRAPSPRRAS